MDEPAVPFSPDDATFEALYAELKRIAHARLRHGGRDVLLDTTALVHEAWMRLDRHAGLQFPDRARFLGYASRVMRSVVIDLVRQRRSGRGGGDFAHVTLTGDVRDLSGPASEEHILRVHEALQDLEKTDRRMAQVVEMRWFGGFSDAEIAAALGVAERTVRRDWEHARLLLAQALQ